MTERTHDQEASYVPCPRCAEPIRSEATACRYCNLDLATSDSDAKPQPSKRLLLLAALAALLVAGGLAVFFVSSGDSREVTAVNNKLACSDFQDEESEALSPLAVCVSKRLGSDLAAVFTGDSNSDYNVNPRDAVGCIGDYGSKDEEQELAECLLDKGL